VLHIDGPPSIAVNAMISTDLYSDFLDATAYTFLNVLPVEIGTVAIIAYLRDERVQSYTAYGDMWDASGDHQRYLGRSWRISSPGRDSRPGSRT